MIIESKHVRYIAAVACTGLAISVGATGMTANAATKSTGLSGVTAMTTTSSSDEDKAVDEGASTAGVTLLMGNALADDATATVAANSASLVQTANASYEDVAIAQVESYANVRALPDENSEVVGMIYNNCGASIIDTQGDWYKIVSGNVTGFIKKEFLVVGNADLARSVSQRQATVSATAIDVFEQPDRNSISIGKFPQGETFTVVDESTKDSGWIKITCENGDGFVTADVVTLSTKYNLAETVAEANARLAQEEAMRQAAAEAQMKQFLKAAQANQSKSSSSKSSSSSSSRSGSGRSYSAPNGAGGSAVASYASQFIGNPYVYGGSSLTNGTDCSGFVMSVYAQFGVSLPHSSWSQQNCGYSVGTGDMQPGDIVCYGSHVGIYVGDGQIVHASNERDGIKVSNANYRSIADVRRIY
jgi:cell wall-associated NlpC family hydrolase